MSSVSCCREMFQQQPQPQHSQHPYPHQPTPYVSYPDYELRQEFPHYSFQEVQLGLRGGLGGFGPGPSGVLAGVSGVSAGGPGLPVGVGGPPGGAAPAPAPAPAPLYTSNPATSFPGHAATATLQSATPFAAHRDNRTVAPQNPSSSNNLRDLSIHFKMEISDDLAAQEAAARDYQPHLGVCTVHL